MELKNKNVFVTGSTRGIGLAVAHKFASLGANVVLNGNAYNQVYINLPKNISFTFYIPKDLESNRKIIVNSLNIPDAFAQFLIFALIIVALILLVFVLIFPIEIETKAQPFCSAVRMKLEIAVIFYTSALTLLLTGSIYLS